MPKIKGWLFILSEREKNDDLEVFLKDVTV